MGTELTSNNDLIDKLEELERTYPEQVEGAKEGDVRYLKREVASEIIRSLKRRSKNVVKRLFIHSLLAGDTGTTIYALDHGGSYNKDRRRIVRDCRFMNRLEALEIALARLAENVGTHTQLIGVIDPAKVVLQDDPPPLRKSRLRAS